MTMPLVSKRIQIAVMAGLPLMASLFCAPLVGADDFTLQTVHQDIREKFKTVTHLKPETLKAGLTDNPDHWLIFDVRERDEFSVSHIKGAELLPPGTSRKAFLKSYKDQIKGKQIVFYCSVGMRSSQMAERMQKAALSHGAVRVYNLQEGVFGWSNRNFTMVNAKGKTAFIHPFNKHWGKLLTSRERWQFERP